MKEPTSRKVQGEGRWKDGWLGRKGKKCTLNFEGVLKQSREISGKRYLS